MCSKTGQAGSQAEAAADLAARLSGAIDELAAVAGRDDSSGPQLADGLARAWSMITAADPELASRAAQY